MEFKPTGVCARNIKYEVNEGIVSSVYFDGGCPGNSQGISRLVEGMEINDVINRLQGIKCGSRGTSCPDQFAKALSENI